MTQSLSECQGGVRGIGVWLRGIRIPIQLALWLKMSLYLSLGLEHEYTIKIFRKSEWAVPFPFRFLYYLDYSEKTEKEEKSKIA